MQAGLALAIKGHEGGSGDEQLTPTAEEQPMVLWESEGPTLPSNGLGGLDDGGGGKAADSTVELDQVAISLKPEAPQSASPLAGVLANEKVVDDDTLTRRKGKTGVDPSVEPAKETKEAKVETVKEKAINEPAKPQKAAEKALVANAETETTVPPDLSDAKGKVSEAKTTPAKKVSPPSSKTPTVDTKKPTPRAGSAAGRPTVRPKSMIEAKEKSPVRPAVPAKPALVGARAGQLRNSASPNSSKESSPVRQPGRPSEVSPSRGTDAAAVDRGAATKPKTAAAPGKVPTRQPATAGSPRGRAVARTITKEPKADGSPSRGLAVKLKSDGAPGRGPAGKPKSSGSPSHSPGMKRKADAPSVKTALSKLAQEGQPTEKPISRVRSDETNTSSPASQPKAKEGAEKEGSGSNTQSPEKKTDKGDGEADKKQGDAVLKGAADVQKRKKRRTSSGSSGRWVWVPGEGPQTERACRADIGLVYKGRPLCCKSTVRASSHFGFSSCISFSVFWQCSEEGRRSRTASRSSADDGEELKEAMKRRSLPRQQVDFTVKRQEMNMMHGYKKMLVVKQVRRREEYNV